MLPYRLAPGELGILKNTTLKEITKALVERLLVYVVFLSDG